jgi:LuxR family transcriptional regulator, maltose regulon positive regulatory protein
MPRISGSESSAAGDGQGGHPGSGDPVLTSTLEPPHLPSRPIIRARLQDRLTYGVREKSLVLVSAPAGAGKTVLAASWAEAHDLSWPVAWLTVDDACDRSEVFWSYVAETIVRSGVTLRHASRPPLGEVVPNSFFIRLAADILDHPVPVVLVLDGADRLASRDATAGLDFLLRHARPQFRLVMCGRADPLLPLHKYRVTDSVAELRQDALAFTVAEAHSLLSSLGAKVSRDVVASLTEQTEGWAAGLRLAAASLKQGADPKTLVESLAGDDGSVAEYLFAEVLDAQPPRVRDFLLRTSITPQLLPDLVDRLTGRTDGRRTLATLVRANAFVERPPDFGGAYRVHPLFRELLKAQLTYESPQDIPELQRRCAQWFAEAGQYVPAVEHAVAGGDWQQATSLLIDGFAVGSLLAHDNCPYQVFLDSMPADLPGPHAAVLRTAWMFRSGEPVPAGDIEQVTRLVEQKRAADTVLRLSAAVVLTAVTAVATEPGRAMHVADRALKLLGQSTPEDQAIGAVLRAILLTARATALLLDRGGEDAAEALKAALVAADAAGCGRLKRQCRGDLAVIEALRGRLRRATELGQAAEGLADDCGLPREQRPAAASLALAWVSCEEFHHAEARRWEARAHASGGDYQARFVQPLLAVLQARIHRSRRDLELAEKALGRLVANGDSPSWVRERELLEIAALHLAQARPVQAIEVLDGLPDPHSPRAEVVRSRAAALGAAPQSEPRDVTRDQAAPVDAVVEAWIDRAYNHLERGEILLAVPAVQEALQLAEPERMRRPFMDSTSQLRRLLRANATLSASASWLRPSSSKVVKLHPASADGEATKAPSPSFVATEPLSEREIEVLRLMSELLSTEEIGAAMFVSVNTVRTHVRSILRKLAVSRRNEAVRRARELAIV